MVQTLARAHSDSYKSRVRLALHVEKPPEKPYLVFDGDCNFCRMWVRRWECTTGTRITYLPFQDPQVGVLFPELTRERFENAVHLVETDGTVFSGAEAALRTLAHSDYEPLFLDWYLRWPWFARVAEAVYRFIASHRVFFSKLTRLCWGDRMEPSTYQLVRWVFLRGLGIIYLIAFVSFWVQAMGLVGSHGILPASLTMFGLKQEANTAHVGWARYHMLPTLCWISSSDGFLHAQCAAGTVLSLLLVLGIAPAPCLFLLWLIYLSLSVVSREFLSFQWDNLLLEAGFLAIFFAPLRWKARQLPSPPPSRLLVWLFRWLVFRLMLGSGLVKLLSGDPAWRHLTALKYHYETQPLPTWIGWYAHQLPASFQKLSVLVMFAIELVLPFFVFLPRRLRQWPCIAFILLQILIFLTGNYGFFNLLSILLCLPLLDDAALARLLPVRWIQRHPPIPEAPALVQQEGAAPQVPPSVWQGIRAAFQSGWPIQVTVPLTCLAVAIPAMQLGALFRLRIPWPGPMLATYNWLSPFRTFNNYGLFAVMTTNRREIVVQGSTDGVTWFDYEFKYKPGNVKRAPGFVEPHQPRLDWQMWFAALSDYRHNLWLVEFCARLLNGSPEVLALLANNPFPRAPPRYIRAVLYEYHFTDMPTHRRTGAWWRRELKGEYLPVLSRRQSSKQR